MFLLSRKRIGSTSSHHECRHLLLITPSVDDLIMDVGIWGAKGAIASFKICCNENHVSIIKFKLIMTFSGLTCVASTPVLVEVLPCSLSVNSEYIFVLWYFL